METTLEEILFTFKQLSEASVFDLTIIKVNTITFSKITYVNAFD